MSVAHRATLFAVGLLSSAVTVAEEDWATSSREVVALLASTVEMRDPDPLQRFSGVRNLSFLTLADFGRSRLFLGVNENGLLGLHFCGVRRDDEWRFLEVARSPYLSSSEQRR